MQARNLHAKRFHLYAGARILCKVDIRIRTPTVAHSRGTHTHTHSIIMYKERVREGRQNGEQTKARYYSVLS